MAEEANTYAKSVNSNLSDLITSYLQTLTKKEKINPDIDADLNELIGCISDIGEEISYKSLKGDYLKEKLQKSHNQNMTQKLCSNWFRVMEMAKVEIPYFTTSS